MFAIKYLFLTLLFSIFFIGNTYAQKSEYDNLVRQVDSLLDADKSYHKEDTIKLHLYENLQRVYIKLDKSKEVSLYTDKTATLAQKLNLKAAVGKAYYRVGFYHHNYSNYSSAEDYYLRSITEFSALQDKEWMGGVYQNLSAMYVNIPDYIKALNANFKAIELFSSIKDEGGVAGCYYNIANIYKDLNQYGTCIRYLEKALAIFQKNKGNDYGVALCYANLGEVYFNVEKRELKPNGKRFQKTLQALEQSLKIADKVGYADLKGNIFLTKGHVYQALGDRELALSFYQKSAANYANATGKKEKAGGLMALANFYIDDNQYADAIPLLAEVVAIANENKLLGLQRDAYLALNKIAEKKGNYKEALKCYKKYVFYKEQIFNQEKEKEITRKQLKLDFSIKEKAYQDKQDFQQKLAFLLAALVLVLFSAAILVYRSQRKTAKLNQLVIAQKEELEKLGKVKDRIFSVVSHDMRTPVNSLMSFINLLEMGNVSEEKLKRYAANLKNSLGYTSTMMENLLNWAYGQMDGFKPHIVSLPVASTLANLVAAMQEQASQKKISLTLVDEHNAAVLADKDMFLLVIRNLVSNAIKFTPENGAVQISVIEKNGETQISIQDSGVGLPSQDVADFNNALHFGVNKTTLGTNNEKGTGIGLSLCKTFVHLMNGRISLKSEVNKGCTFFIDLPK
ncbi:ATP-binding protein [Pedobacter sp. UBA4863]|uniref:tetratricopeptide repeat-containing sensor histidine kinase n=1 Tax=Pedobacter sp. UBA4863 TaxID=1947060 RepID=UPI0025D4B0EE|nr:ATP-binding protein [Pedobacter sp. UBA4863]